MEVHRSSSNGRYVLNTENFQKEYTDSIIDDVINMEKEKILFYYVPQT
jgi:DNA-dependent RNA polymerase auxiliary subunit epsilon